MIKIKKLGAWIIGFIIGALSHAGINWLNLIKEIMANNL
jgi:hypothetical protein